MATMERTKEAERYLGTENMALPAGYRIEPVLAGLNYPTSVCWDADGNMLLAESTLSFGRVAPTEIRILRRRPDQALETVVGGLEHLINDLAVHQGVLYVSHRGKVSVVEDGRVRDIIGGLPAWGLHQNNALAFGPDGRLYFGQGTISNAGVVDTFALYHLRREKHLEDCDVPGAAVVLTGRNYGTHDLLGSGETRVTGAFSPWGRATSAGERIPGPGPGRAATGAIMTANADGSELRVYAWGFRNPFGLAFGPDERLYVANEGANRIPPRQITSDPDTLWQAEEGGWYGWPDFFAGQPVTDPAFKPPNAPRHEFLIANHAELLRGRDRPPAPVLSFGLHVAPTKFAFCHQPEFGYPGQAFVPAFGSLLTPVEGLPRQQYQGFRVLHVDVAQRTVSDFVVNRSGKPASQSDGRGGLERPIQAAFGPDGSLYIVDLGVLELRPDGWVAPGGSGVVWRVRREAQTGGTTLVGAAREEA